ncbi:MAG: helix-turn-helix transcriptional regulator, partial [Streptomyces sp.]|nr:helix-turn-helix transcriptional regulator [Streptomyces sp.]
MQASMTQEELADRSGLSIRTISDLERGRTTMPRRRSLAMLAEALQIRDGSLERFHKSRQLEYTAACPNCGTSWP